MSQAMPFPLAEAEMNEGPLLTVPIYSLNVRDVSVCCHRPMARNRSLGMSENRCHAAAMRSLLARADATLSMAACLSFAAIPRAESIWSTSPCAGLFE